MTVSLRSQPPIRLDTEALKGFSARLPDRGEILDLGLGDGGAALLALRSLGFEVSALAAESSPFAETAEARWGAAVRDLRLATLPRERFDGLWCHRILPLYPIDHVQRILALAFQSLKPKTGIALFSFLAGEAPPPAPSEPEAASLIRRPEDAPPARNTYREMAFLSALRQSGFQAISRGELREPSGDQWIAVLARRI